MDDLIQQAAAIINKAIRNNQVMVVLTGAGVSKESGVPTFRDAMDGLWAKYDPQQLATPQAFLQNPKLVWDWYTYRRGLVRDAQPNPGHYALAEIERRFSRFLLVTQNVDDLHEQAGSTKLVHLHGRINETKCFFNCQGDPTIVDLSTITIDPANTPPNCPHCGRWLRPNVVWFNEMLPTHELSTAVAASKTCDLMIVVGTSGLVEPAASLPRIAHDNGAKIIEVNPDTSMITPIADIKLEGASGVMLPKVVAALS